MLNVTRNFPLLFLPTIVYLTRNWKEKKSHSFCTYLHWCIRTNSEFNPFTVSFSVIIGDGHEDGEFWEYSKINAGDIYICSTLLGIAIPICSLNFLEVEKDLKRWKTKAVKLFRTSANSYLAPKISRPGTWIVPKNVWIFFFWTNSQFRLPQIDFRGLF